LVRKDCKLQKIVTLWGKYCKDSKLFKWEIVSWWGTL